MYATAHGVYDIWINDVHVDDWYMAPGFTQYSDVLQTQHYDISKYLKAGDNKMLVQVGDGWYRGSLDKEQVINSFGSDCAFLCQIQSMGNVLKISDSSWQAANDGWLGHNDMHDGEEYDARKVEDEFSWQEASVIEGDYSVLTGTDAPKITTHEVFEPELITTPNGEKVLDFGQNFSGYVAINVDAPFGGETIKLTHGETLDEDGNFSTKNFQASKDIITKQEVNYICKKGNNSYHQTTTYFGFRYVKVETDLDITEDNFTGVAVYSDMDQTGFFTSGNSLVNQLYSNTLWSMKSNFVSVMTDCPTREKSGYSGDGQIFIDTALYMMDSAPVYNAWMNSYRHMFNEDGSLMQFTPTKLTHSMYDSSHGWCDAIVIVPYKLWKQSGDISVIENYYDDSKKWVDYALERAGKKTHLVNKLKLDNDLEDYFADQGFGWGEWLEAGYKDKFSSIILLAHNTLMGESEVGTAFLYSSCAQMAEMAEALGKDDDAKFYSEAAEKAREAYRKVYTNNGEITEKYRQCRYVRPIALGLLDENESKAASDKLVGIIESNNDHLNTGFLSTGSLLNSLSDYGNVTKAYDVLLQKTAPSWLYSVSQGATTIWETWDGKESLNHYSYGAVCSWLMNTAAGINYTDGQITISPKPDARLGYAEASYDSPVGTIRSGWCYVDGELVYEVEIPAGQTATLQIGDESQTIGEGIHVIK